MKGRNGWAREHLVPLSSAAQEVINSLPRTKNAPYLFSFNGKLPLAMNSPIKRDLDRRMLRILQAMARHRGEDHTQVTLPNWTNHDLRRVVRSGLSALRIPHNVAEAVLAHRPPGIVGTYDVYGYFDEKREASEKWAEKLASIVDPKPTTPAKVIRLRRRVHSSATNIVDEYTDEEREYKYKVSPKTSIRPLRLRQLIAMIDGAAENGLVGHARAVLNEQGSGGPQDIWDFETAVSTFYPQLAAWYAECSAEWLRTALKDWGEDEEDNELGA